MRTTTRERWLWPPVVAYMALIFALSSISGVPALPGGRDKLLHALLYGGLAILTVRAAAGGFGRRVPIGAAARAIVIVVAYGLSDELHQRFVPNRSFELMDLAADGAGAVIAAAALVAGSRIAGDRKIRAV